MSQNHNERPVNPGTEVIYELCVEDVLMVADDMGIPRTFVLENMPEIKKMISDGIDWYLVTKKILSEFKKKIQ